VSEDPFYLTAVVLGVAAVIGFLATRLRQPLIVAFIAVGIVVGPSVLGWVERAEPLELFAEIGIAVLLFLVGLKLDLHLIRTTGPVALVTGLGQVAFTSGIGFVLAYVLGMDPVTALFVAVALTFSSTIIIVKLLSDKRELDQLHGRVALGFLIVQDIVVVLVMIVLSTFGGETGNDLMVELFLVVVRAAGLVIGLAAIMKWVLPWVLHRLARSQELLIVSAVAWAVSMAAFGDWLGFSIEVGAFLAGFALASTPFRESIGSSLTPLRDFLLLFFFIELGARLDFGAMGTQIPAAILLSIFVLVGNPLIVLVIMGLMGYRRRVGFLAGLTVAQISEFSLIFVTLGFDLGHVGDETVGLVTLVGLVTIGLSTYMILYSHVLFERLEPFLGVFERKRPTKGDEDLRTDDTVDAVVFGVGRFGAALTEQLLEEDLRVLVVDWDPQRIQDEPEHPRLELVFGDAEDGEFPATLPLQRVRSVVCTIPAPATSAVLVSSLRRNGYDGPIAVTAHTRADAEWLRSVDADLVLQPFEDAAGSGSDSVIALLTDGSSGDGTGSAGRREPEQGIDTAAESGERT
jgi:Kef-type K+ transport system membrane component KefB